KDNSGGTPQRWATKNEHEAVVKLLFGFGKVEADSKDNSRRTPLLWTHEDGHEAVIKL
ncbi:hypothetical protein K469DRAFT_522420, partial [Zopfia rhizophila CBS 207.26]